MREKLRELLAALTEGCEPGPWHAVENSDSPFRWWLENAAGDSSYPDPADVALMVNALPELLDRLDRLEGALDSVARAYHEVARYPNHLGSWDGKHEPICNDRWCNRARAALEDR